MKLEIVVPCYNEEKNIPLILEKFKKVIGKRNIIVVLVNNGSTDQSAAVLEELLPKYSFARTVFVPVNQGYGYGILQGLNSCTADYIGWTHADMQTDPKDVIKAYDYLQKNSEKLPLFMKGTRRGRPFFDSFFTFGMSVFETVYMGTKLVDINAQPNIFPKSFYDTWKEPPYDFSLDLYASYMAKKQDLKICRFQVQFPERIHGTSSWNTGLKSKWKFIKRTLEFSRSLKKRGIR